MWLLIIFQVSIFHAESERIFRHVLKFNAPLVRNNNKSTPMAMKDLGEKGSRQHQHSKETRKSRQPHVKTWGKINYLKILKYGKINFYFLLFTNTFSSYKYLPLKFLLGTFKLTSWKYQNATICLLWKKRHLKQSSSHFLFGYITTYIHTYSTYWTSYM